MQQPKTQVNPLSFIKRWRQLLLLLSPLGAILALTLHSLDLSQVWLDISRIPLRTLLWAQLLVNLQVIFHAMRLYALLDRRFDLSPLRVFHAFSLGQVLNLFLPGRVGDGLKIVILSRSSRGRSLGMAHAAGSVLVADKLIDLVGLVSLLAISFVLTPVPLSELRTPPWVSPAWMKQGWLARVWIPLLVLCIGALTFFLLGSRVRTWFHHALQSARQLLHGALTPFQPGKGIPALAFTLPAWVCEAWSLHVLADPLGYSLSLTQCLILLGILNLVIAIPLTPANVGTFEAALVFGLALFHVPLTEALAIAAVHHLIQLLSVLICYTAVALGLFLITQKKTPSVDNAENHDRPL